MNGNLHGSLIPDEELHRAKSLQLTPLIDFFLLILTAIALITTTWALLHEESYIPASSEQDHVVLLKMDDQSHYKWVSQFNECLLYGVDAAIQELRRQQMLGLLPGDKEKIQILLRINPNLHWHHIEKAILSIKRAGFNPHPIYADSLTLSK